MATDQEMINQMNAYRRARDKAHLRTALEAPAMVGDYYNAGGQKSARSIWDEYNPRDARMTGAEGMAAKQSVLEAIAKMKEARAKIGGDIATEMAKGNPDAINAVFDLFKTMGAAALTAQGNVTEAKLVQGVNLTKEKQAQLASNLAAGRDPLTGRTLGSTAQEGPPLSAAQKAAISKVAESSRAQGATSPNSSGGDFTATKELADAFPGVTNPETLRQADAYMREVSGGQSLQGFLGTRTGVSTEVDGLAQNVDQALTFEEQVVPGVMREQNAILAAMADAIQSAAGPGFSGSGVADKLADFFKQFEARTDISIEDLMGGSVDEEKLSKTLDELWPEGGENDPEKGLGGMLDEIDRAMETDPTVAEYKDAIINSDAFQAYMQAKGFPPGAEKQAWQALKVQARVQKQEAQREGSKILHDTKMEAIRNRNEPPPAPSKAAELVGGAERGGASTQAKGKMPPEQVIAKAQEDLKSGNLAGYKVYEDPEGADLATRLTFVSPDGHVFQTDNDAVSIALYTALPQEAVLPDPPEDVAADTDTDAPESAGMKSPEKNTPPPPLRGPKLENIGTVAGQIAGGVARPLETGRLAADYLKQSLGKGAKDKRLDAKAERINEQRASVAGVIEPDPAQAAAVKQAESSYNWDARFKAKRNKAILPDWGFEDDGM